MRALLLLLLLLAVAGCSFEPGTFQPADATADSDGGLDTMSEALADGPCPDEDGDGVCNVVDDWPCGVKPAAPSGAVMIVANSGLTNVAIDTTSLGGTGLFAVAAPSSTPSLTFQYAITDTACTGNCVDQIEVGWSPGGRIACPFDSGVSRIYGASGTITTTVTAPATPQSYDLRVNLGQNYSCNYSGATAWWGSTPGSNGTIAKLCVH